MDDHPALVRPAPHEPVPMTVVDALADMLVRLGVRHAFGVSGGGIAAFWAALTASPIRVCHFRHESGAAFAATEASLATGEPVVVFTTTGPGLTNALTGMLAARGDGARVILVSAYTSADKQRRWAIQETGPGTLPPDLYAAGPLFHAAWILQSAEDCACITSELARGIARPSGFTAHLALPTALQARPAWRGTASIAIIPEPPPDAQEAARLLAAGRFAIWVGFGARHAADRIRALAERSQVAVFCSPRGKGIFPEDHALFVGVTGMGGHNTPRRFMQTHRPRHVLVLGTRLGEPTSFWDPDMVPVAGFIHVDIDSSVPGAAYPGDVALAVQAEIAGFVEALLKLLPVAAEVLGWNERPHPPAVLPRPEGLIRPDALMTAIQTIVVDGSDAQVMAESGNAFAWTTNHLRFAQPGRYRVSTGTGAMGHGAAGVVGTAIATGRKAVCVLGDGAMLMTNEISSAVQHGARCVWIVLNDARYNMCQQGMATLGLEADASIPKADFAMLARAMGADGLRVTSGMDLHAALETAMAARGPFVVDVDIDPNCVAPALARNRGLLAEGVGVATQAPDLSFPQLR